MAGKLAVFPHVLVLVFRTILMILSLLQKEDTSPASFEKTLSALTAKITATQTTLDATRSNARRYKVLCTLSLLFAYIVYSIVGLLVIGYQRMSAALWSGMAAGPVAIYLVHRVLSLFYDYRIDKLNARLKYQQTERAKTIQKLKDATRYDSTQELLEKYGGGEGKRRGGKKKTAGEEEEGQENKPKGGDKIPGRTHMLPPPTANIQRPHTSAGPGSPVPQPSPFNRRDSPFNSPRADVNQSDDDITESFAPNAFDASGPPPPQTPALTQHQQRHPPVMGAAPSESHWYDRIFDALLGEDETAAKNRIVLICSRCRLVNGQAPPGTKSLAEVGQWKCMACGAMNGEVDEGIKIMREVLGKKAAVVGSEMTDDDLSAGGGPATSGDEPEEEIAGLLLRNKR